MGDPNTEQKSEQELMSYFLVQKQTGSGRKGRGGGAARRQTQLKVIS